MTMFRDSNNKISMMRVGFFSSIVIGAITVLSGIIMSFYNIGDGSALVNSGTLLMTGSGFSKAVQSGWGENKK